MSSTWFYKKSPRHSGCIFRKNIAELSRYILFGSLKKSHERKCIKK